MRTAESEFARGWPLLATSFVGIATGASSLYFYSLGVFIKPLAAEFGWGRGEASLGALVGTLCAAVMAYPTGRLVDRFGGRSVALCSLALLSGGFALLGAATANLASFIAITTVLSLLTAGASPLPFTRLIVAPFRRNRGIALGIALAGTGLGAILIPALLSPFIASHGWRLGYFVLAGVAASAVPIVWALLLGAMEQRSAPHEAAGSGRVLGAPDFWLLAFMFFMVSTAVLGTVVHFVPMLTDAGFSPERAGRTTGLIGVAAIAGRLIAGALLDRAPAGAVTGGLFALAASGLAALAFGGAARAAAGALITGLAIGAEVDLIAFLVGRFFPCAVYGRAYGALYAVFLLGAALGPTLSGYLFDLSGDYRLSLLGGSALLAAASLLSLLFSRLQTHTE